MLEHVVQLAGYRLGLLRTFTKISWPSVERLVFVCHGNICRSPYAEAVARNRCGMASASFGIGATTGVGANGSAIRNAEARNIDLRMHRATSMGDFVAHENDLLIAMEPRQGMALKRLAGRSGSAAQITLLGLWTPKPRPYIADPYGLSDAYFQNCFKFIDSAIEGLATRCQR